MKKGKSINKAGILCPACNSDESKIFASRRVGGNIRRERECLECGFSFYTCENILLDDCKFFIETAKGTVQKKTFAQIKEDISRYIVSDEDSSDIYSNITQWILKWRSTETAGTKLYRTKKVVTLPEDKYKKLIMAGISIINSDIGTVYYLNEISTQRGKNKKKTTELNKISDEIQEYINDLNNFNN